MSSVSTNSRLEKANKKLDLISIDACCRVRNKYQTICEACSIARVSTHLQESFQQ